MILEWRRFLIAHDQTDAHVARSRPSDRLISSSTTDFRLRQTQGTTQQRDAVSLEPSANQIRVNSPAARTHSTRQQPQKTARLNK
jgi:hypothetical protein